MVCVEFPTEVGSEKVSLWVPSASRQAPGEGPTKAAWMLLGPYFRYIATFGV